MAPRAVMRICVGAAGLLLVLGVVAQHGARVVRAAGSYRLVENWAQIPAGQQVGFASWIDVDARGIVYVFRRCPVRCADGAHPKPPDPPGSVWMFDRSGKFIGEWRQPPEGLAQEAHGLHIDRGGFIWTTDVQRHDVRKYRADGTLVMTLGKPGVPGETNDTFNQPTQVFVAATGDVFVTDGYGNQRMVKLDKNGKFVKAWGTKGTGPGQFRLPHSVTQDSRGRIIVADRCGLGATKCTDGRVQIFDVDGKYLSEWKPPGGGPFAPFAVDISSGDRLYVGDSQNRKVWIIDAPTGKVLETVDDVSLHGMSVTPSGDDIYIAASTSGIRRYTRGS